MRVGVGSLKSNDSQLTSNIYHPPNYEKCRKHLLNGGAGELSIEQLRLFANRKAYFLTDKTQ